MNKKMNGKIIIKTTLNVLTGMHIGGSNAYSAIGTADSPVIKSAKDNKPIVPGSSLKGKLRSLLASVASSEEDFKEIDKDSDVIKRLFGSAKPVKPARLQFSDAYINNKSLSVSKLTEIKFENTINRETCQANPRQIERVVPGVSFDVFIVYNVEKPEEIDEDMKTLAEGMKLLQYDYLGGHGSRGSGRVGFSDFAVTFVGVDEDKTAIETKIQNVFEEEVVKNVLLDI